MPRFDGTGPFGTGPVGRRLGPCWQGRQNINFLSRIGNWFGRFGRGFGRGKGWGRGRGAGRGMGMGRGGGGRGGGFGRGRGTGRGWGFMNWFNSESKSSESTSSN